jgi:hypothetical protein
LPSTHVVPHWKHDNSSNSGTYVVTQVTHHSTLSEPQGLTPFLCIHFYYIWDEKFRHSPKNTAKIWSSDLYFLLSYGYQLHTHTRTHTRTRTRTHTPHTHTPHTPHTHTHTHTHTHRLLVLLCRLWTHNWLCVSHGMPAEFRYFFIGVLRRRMLQMGRNLNRYFVTARSNRELLSVLRGGLLFFVYTSQLAASFVTKKRHCELSIIARGRDRPNFPSLWSVSYTEMRTLCMKPLHKECLYSRHYQCMQALRPRLSSCFWIMEQLSLWCILLCDEAQFNRAKTEFNTQSYRPQIILTISIPTSSNNVFRWLCGVALAVTI